MKINEQDLIKWKENTISIGYKFGLDIDTLKKLENIDLNVLSGTSGKLFYGYASYGNSQKSPIIEVYKSNPSKYFPKVIREIWNQSGMDHELLGHQYGRLFDNDGFENYAQKMQIDLAKFRGKKSILWKLAAKTLPILFKSK